MLKDTPLDSLNEEQRMAVTCTEGPVLINAGAGSGKTRVLTSRIALLMSRGVPPGRILALTFTKKAANEMKRRIYAATGFSTRELCMGTFHSVFIRFLRDYADRLGYPREFTIYDEDDFESALRQCVLEVLYGTDWKEARRAMGEERLAEAKRIEARYRTKSVRSRISLAKNNLISASDYALDPAIAEEDRRAGRELMPRIFLLYQRRLKTAGVMDFDDILINTDWLLKNVPEALQDLGHRFDYILVDEYQDTNYAQYSVLRSLTRWNGNICVVGDDSQSIYAFRGAQIKNILKFNEDFPQCRTFRLETNYRSTSQIVEAANNIISHNTIRLPKTCHSTGVDGNAVKVVETASEKGEALYLAKVILGEVERNGRSYSDFAVLYRTNAQSRAIEDILLRARIPYTVYSGVSFFERMEVRDLLSYFKLAVNNNDNEAFKRAVAKPSRGIGNAAVTALEVAAANEDTSIYAIASRPDLSAYGLKPKSEERIRAFVSMMDSFTADARTLDAYSVATRIGRESGLRAMYGEDDSEEGRKRTENLDELLNNVASVSDDIRRAIGTPATLGQYLEDMALLSNADTGDDGDDRDRVSLMTVHCAKGLEYPFVFVTGVEKDIFPSISAQTPQEIEEERRLFYVAATRAKERLVITHAQQRYRFGRRSEQSPSPFLLEVFAASAEDMPEEICQDAAEPGDEW